MLQKGLINLESSNQHSSNHHIISPTNFIRYLTQPTTFDNEAYFGSIIPSPSRRCSCRLWLSQHPQRSDRNRSGTQVASKSEGFFFIVTTIGTMRALHPNRSHPLISCYIGQSLQRKRTTLAMAIVMQVERIRARLCMHLRSVMLPALVLLRFCLVSNSTAVNRCCLLYSHIALKLRSFIIRHRRANHIPILQRFRGKFDL